MRLYSTRADSPESRLFDLPPADILSISSTGEMAVLLKPNIPVPTPPGTLARVPIAGGAPRDSGGRPGSGLVAGRQGAGGRPKDRRSRRRLEYPIGKTLYEAEISPRLGSLQKAISSPSSSSSPV